MRRTIVAPALGVLASLAIASSAFAFDCMNASKPDQAAGTQVVINTLTGEIEWVSLGVAARLANGIIDEEGTGLHGLIGLDFDGDEVVDVSTWFGVGPSGFEIAEPALLNGPACRGVTSIGLYFSECLAP